MTTDAEATRAIMQRFNGAFEAHRPEDFSTS